MAQCGAYTIEGSGTQVPPRAKRLMLHMLGTGLLPFSIFPLSASKGHGTASSIKSLARLTKEHTRLQPPDPVKVHQTGSRAVPDVQEFDITHSITHHACHDLTERSLVYHSTYVQPPCIKDRRTQQLQKTQGAHGQACGSICGKACSAGKPRTAFTASTPRGGSASAHKLVCCIMPHCTQSLLQVLLGCCTAATTVR